MEPSDLERLPPPPFWRTRYFTFSVMARRRGIDMLDIGRVLAHPLRKEREPGGRIRHWGWLAERRTYLRVVTLEDGETVHNAFFDRDFSP